MAVFAEGQSFLSDTNRVPSCHTLSLADTIGNNLDQQLLHAVLDVAPQVAQIGVTGLTTAFALDAAYNLGKRGREFRRYEAADTVKFWQTVDEQDTLWQDVFPDDKANSDIPRSRQGYRVRVSAETVRYKDREDRRAIRDLSGLSEMTTKTHPSGSPLIGYRRDYTFEDRTLHADPRVLDGDIRVAHSVDRDGALANKTVIAEGIDFALSIPVRRSITYHHFRFSGPLGSIFPEEIGVHATEERFLREGGSIIRHAVSVPEVHKLQRTIFSALPPVDIYG